LWTQGYPRLSANKDEPDGITLRQSRWPAAMAARRPCGSGATAPLLVASIRLGQLLQNRRILKRGHVLRDVFALRNHAQQASHDLARTGLRQVFAIANFAWLGDGADFAAHPVP